MTGGDVFIAGSIGPLGDVELRPETRTELFAEQASILEGRGADLFMIETFYDLDELETAIEAVRSVSRLPIVALMTFDDEAQTLGGRDGEERRASDSPRWASRPSARTTAPAPRARSPRSPGHAARRARARCAAERRPGEPGGPPHRLSARDAGVFRGVRGAGAQPRRRRDRRLLRDDARRDRRDPRRDRREPRRRRARSRSTSDA